MFHNTSFVLTKIPGDYPEPSRSASESTRRPIEACTALELSSDVQSALEKLRKCGEKQFSSFSVFLSALVILVSRLTGDENITVGIDGSNGVPSILRTAVDLNEPFGKLLPRVNEVRNH